MKKKRTEKADFQRYFDHITQLDKVLHLSLLGLHRVSAMLSLAEAIEKLPPHLRGDTDTHDDEAPQSEPERLLRLERLREQAAFAQEEAERGFPILHANAVISHWAALEALIFNLAVRRLELEPSLLDKEDFANIKVRLAEFHRLDDRDRIEHMVREIARNSNAEYMPGVAKFERILSTIGLSGQVDEPIRKTLFEMYHVRNVLVHRLGVADRRFLEACPWLGLKRGDSLTISQKEYRTYRQALLSYVNTLIERVGRIYAVDTHTAQQ